MSSVRAASPHSPGGDSDDEFEEAAKRHQEAMAALLKKRQKQEAEAKMRRAEKDALDAKMAAEAQEADRRAADEQRRLAIEQHEREETTRREEVARRREAEEEREQQTRLETEARVRKQLEAEEATRLESERLAEEQRQARLAEERAREAARLREVAERHRRDVQLLCEEEEPHLRDSILKIERESRKDLLNREEHLRFELHDELSDQKRRKELREAFEIKQQQRDAEERARLRQLEIEAAEKKKSLDEAHRKQLLLHLQADLSLLEGEEKISREMHSRQQQIDYETLHRDIRQELAKHESQQELINSLRATITRLETTIAEDRRASRDAFHEKDQRIRELEEEVNHMRDSIESISADVEGSTELHSFLKTKAVDVAQREALVVSLEKDLRELSVVLQQEFVTVKSLTRRLRLLVADTNCQVVACVSAARSELQKRQKQHARELTSSLNSALTAAAASASYPNGSGSSGGRFYCNQYDDRPSQSLLTDPAHLRGILSNVNRNMTYGNRNGGDEEAWMNPSPRSSIGNNNKASMRLAGQFQVILTDDLIELLNAHESEVQACSAVVSAQRQALHSTDHIHNINSKRGGGGGAHGLDDDEGVGGIVTTIGRATDASWDNVVRVYYQCIGQNNQQQLNTTSSTTVRRGNNNNNNNSSSRGALSQERQQHPSPPLLILLPTLALAFLQWVAAVTHEHVSTILLANIDTCIRALRAVATVLLTTGMGLVTYGVLMM